MRIVLAIPALNEESVIRDTVERTVDFVEANFPEDEFRIVVVDNGSTDRTGEIVRELAGRRPDRIAYRRLERRGKGLAIRTAWAENPADIHAFLDADLSTDLASLPALIEGVRKNGGLAIGSRYHPDSTVERTILRRLFSLAYRLTLKAVLNTKIGDLPCGFKALSSATVRKILPLVKNDSWFFDTELAIRTERAGYPVTEIPITWHEVNDPNRRTRVSLVRVSAEYLRNSWRLRRELGRKNDHA